MKKTRQCLLGVVTAVLLSLGSFSAQAQLAVIDQEIDREVMWKNTNEEFAVDRLADGRVRICFRATDSKETDLGEIYLASEKEFEELYAIIENGLRELPKTPVRLDLGSSVLRLHFHSVLMGTGALTMVHYYKDSPYSTKTTSLIWAKSIRKIFGQDTLQNK